MQSCRECLNLGYTVKQEELLQEVSVSNVNFAIGKQEDEKLVSVRNKIKYAYDGDDSWYRINYSNIEGHCQELSHDSSHLAYFDQATISQKATLSSASMQETQRDSIAQNSDT